MFAYFQEETDAFLNTPTRSYLTLQFLLLLLVDETDFRRVFPIHPRLVTCSYQCCYPPINKLHELYHIVILCLTDLWVLFHSRCDLSLAFFICSVSSKFRFNRLRSDLFASTFNRAYRICSVSCML